MSRWTSELVARVLDTAPVAPAVFQSIETDSRVLEPGALFVALVGERFDGHTFLGDALARGARGVVVHEDAAVPDGLVAFRVADTLAALGNLARARRRELTGPVVAVTGTNGKTATKEMVAGVLGTRWSVHATRGNLNNLIGVPLTLLGAPDDTEVLVVEAGASVPGEIATLRGIIEPTLTVITNVSAGHLEGFGSERDVLEEKLALAAGVPCAVVGTRPPELAVEARARVAKVVVAGVAPAADVRPTAWQLDDQGQPIVRYENADLKLAVVGSHQVDNVMLALAVGRELGVPAADAAQALSRTKLPFGRCEVLHHGDLVVLHDAYNANPLSVETALETAQAMCHGRPLVVVLGTMLELGPKSDELHAAVADRVTAAQPALIAVTGAFVTAFESHASELGDRLLTADDPATLGERLARRLDGREFVLLKASRGMRLERVIPHLIPSGDA